MDDALKRAADHWSRVTLAAVKGKRRWWQSPGVWRYINRIVDGVPLADAHGGFHRQVAKRSGRVLKKGVSVGCGPGAKEMTLLQMGAVEHFTLYEIAEPRIEMGLKRAQELGLSDRIEFRRADAFEDCKTSDFDIVYWNNALHHMLDVDGAVRWGRERLAPDGLFAMDDFVGPSRFQWTERAMAYASSFRASLPPQYLEHPNGDGAKIPIAITRPTVEAMIQMDPTEAAQSSEILPAIARHFPHADIIPTGGCIYQLAFDDVLANFTEVEDQAIMNAALLVDRALTELGEFHYAVAFARA